MGIFSPKLPVFPISTLGLSIALKGLNAKPLNKQGILMKPFIYLNS